MHNNIWNRRFLRIFTAAILLQMGNQFIMTVLPLYLDGLNFAPSVLGMGHALSAMAAMAGAPLAGALADRKGKGLVLCSGFLIMAAGMLGFIALPMALPIIVIRLVQGFGISAGSVSQTAIATDVLPQEKVKSGLSYFGIAGTIAGAAGSFVGLRLIFGENYAPVWLGGALLFGVGAILGLTFRGTKAPAVPEQAENEHTRQRGLWALLEKSAFLPGVVQLLLMAAGSAYAYLPTYGVETGVRDISLLFTLQAAAFLLATLLLGKIIDRLSDLRLLFVAGLLLSGLAFVCLFFMGGDILFYAAGILNGFGGGISNAAIGPISMSRAPAERRGAAAATYSCMGSLGYSLGSFLWGLAAGSLGYRNIYGIAVLLPIVALFLSMFVFRPIHSKKI